MAVGVDGGVSSKEGPEGSDEILRAFSTLAGNVTPHAAAGAG